MSRLASFGDAAAVGMGATLRRVFWVAGLTPGRSSLVVVALLLAGASEAVGVATLLPLLAFAADSTSIQDNRLGQVVAEVLGTLGVPQQIGPLLALMAVAIALKAGLTFGALILVAHTISKMVMELRLTLIRALIGAKWAYFVDQPTGIIANALTIESNNSGSLYAAAIRIVTISIQVAVYLALALLVSWRVTVGAAIAGLSLYLILSVLVGAGRRAARRQADAFKRLLARIVDSVAGIKPLKAMAAESQLLKMLEWDTNQLFRAQRAVLIMAHAVKSAQEPVVVTFLAVGMYIAFTVWLLPFEAVLLMAFFFYRTVNMMGLLQTAYQGVVNNEPYFVDIIRRARAAEVMADTLGGGREPRFEDAVRLEDVNFSYGTHEVLNGVDIEIPARGITAVVGPSGAGKTTVADLVIGLHQPTSGAVTVDGIPLRDIDTVLWRHCIGYVPQELTLFHDTVLANLTLNDPLLTRGDAESALRAAGAWDFVSALPAGLDAIVGERGTKLSGGQRQRIALARALVRGPALLILDEPTTALDPATEAAICRTIATLRERTTILVISHQRAITDIADNLYHLEGGVLTSRPVVRQVSSGH